STSSAGGGSDAGRVLLCVRKSSVELRNPCSGREQGHAVCLSSRSPHTLLLASIYRLPHKKDTRVGALRANMLPWRALSLAVCLQLATRVTTRTTESQQHVLQANHAPPSTHQQRPNIVFILTDDQDARMDSLAYMPYVQKHLIQRGTTFERHYC